MAEDSGRLNLKLETLILRSNLGSLDRGENIPVGFVSRGSNLSLSNKWLVLCIRLRILRVRFIIAVSICCNTVWSTNHDIYDN